MRRTLALVVTATAVAVPASAQAGGRQPGDRQVTARVETPALFDDEAGGDADADDPPSGCTRGTGPAAW